MRTAFVASRGLSDPAEIAAIAHCSSGVAQLIACARRLACLDVLAAYERGEVTWRQMWRACEYPDDARMQCAVAHVRAA